MISDDLVNSYHLLLCALDLVYGNALQCSNRKELVNPNFKGRFVNQRFLDHLHFCVVFTLGVVQVSYRQYFEKLLSLQLSKVLITKSQASCKNIFGKTFADTTKFKVLNDNFRNFWNIYSTRRRHLETQSCKDDIKADSVFLHWQTLCLTHCRRSKRICWKNVISTFGTEE